MVSENTKIHVNKKVYNININNIIIICDMVQTKVDHIFVLKPYKICHTIV